MGPGGPMGGPPPHEANEKLKEAKPTSLREVPGFVWRVATKTLYRLFYIFRIVWETKPWILFLMVFMSIFNGVTPVIGAYISAQLVNGLVKAYNVGVSGGATMFASVVGLLILQFGFSFFVGLVGRINNILNQIASSLVSNHVNVKIMNKAREIDMASFDRPEFYEKLENASREAGNRPIQIMNATFNIVSTTISMVSFIAILWAVSPFAPFIIIAISIPSAIINFVYRKKNFLYMRRRSKERRQMSYYSGMMTNKDMAKEIRIFGLSDLFIGRYKEIFAQYFKGLKKLFVTEGCWHIVVSLLNTVINCCLFVYIVQQVCAGRMEIGNYNLYTGALNSISSGIGSLISITATIYEGTLFIDNMIAFMDEKPTVKALLNPPRRVQHGIGHVIELRDVSFRYPGTERDVISHVNLTLEPGDTVVLVGLNGAGKTTLIKLITRLYDPTEGQVLLDGHDIREYDPDDLYKTFGIIFQDFGKYAVTVSENISFGQLEKDATDESIRDAAEKSNAADFISKLPDQYQTPLMRYFETNGIELSIGQWQKLSIARAFYSDSDIVILDEPTASLDAIAEQEIYNQFDSLRKDKTCIFVSHRLSSATVANKIVVLEYGKIIEMGNHAELMRLHGHYYELFSTQAKRYIAPVDGIDLVAEERGDEMKDPHRFSDAPDADKPALPEAPSSHGERRDPPPRPGRGMPPPREMQEMKK